VTKLVLGGAISVDSGPERPRSGGSRGNLSVICKLTRRERRIDRPTESLLWVYERAVLPRPQEVTVFATIKSLIPEPRQVSQPRRYVGKHRQPEPMPLPDPAPPAPTAEENQRATV